MTVEAPFQPNPGENQRVTVTTGSNSVNIDPKAKSVRLVAEEFSPIYVRIGEGPQVAIILSDLLIAGQRAVIVQKAEGDDTVAFISSGGGGTILHIQPGEGGA